jgi:hypothetical protein
MPSDNSSKDDFPRPNIVFQPTVFARDLMIEKWPDLHKVIASGDQIAAAFEAIRKSPVWREDPRLRGVSRETADEVLDMYNDVIEDGRHIEDFLKSPGEVAHRLGKRLSDDAVSLIGAVRAGLEREAIVLVVVVPPIIAVAVIVIAVGVAVGVVVSTAHSGDHPQVVIDESGHVKLGSRSGVR